MANRRKIEAKIIREFKKTVNLKKIRKPQLDKIGIGLVDLMKDNIRKGISPITGKRFPKYKNAKKYPGLVRKRFPNKRTRPVNLHLSGDFLRALKSTGSPGKKPKVRIYFTGRKNILKEIGHRRGAGGQPKRPVIPIRNEDFSRKIRQKLDRLVTSILTRAFD
jgi:hypothetical protein